MANNGNMPRGFWFHLNHLPIGTTNESLSEWLASIGINIPVDHIDCKPNRSGSQSATVCYPQSTAIDLLKWALNGQLFNGQTISPEYKLRDANQWW
jgi:hypothetical protein